jgi:hypothetical protein
MVMFLHDVHILERQWGSFNREPYTVSEAALLCKRMSIRLEPDRSVAHAAAFIFEGKKHILYNPHHTRTDILLNIGHEIGHFSLGHVRTGGPPFFSSPLEIRKKMERYAGIIGFLMWLPNTEICKMMHGDTLDIEEMFNYVRWKDSDVTYDYALKLCTARISIFNAYRRIMRLKYRIGSQIPLPFRHLQRTFPFERLFRRGEYSLYY